MSKQGDITKTKSLTKEVARQICEIMGVRYSHHDDDVQYYMDDNPMIYFYEGMSPYVLKLDTVTGEVKPDALGEMGYFMFDEVEKLKEALIKYDKYEEMQSDKVKDEVLTFRANVKKVKEFLIKNEYLNHR